LNGELLFENISEIRRSGLFHCNNAAFYTRLSTATTLHSTHCNNTHCNNTALYTRLSTATTLHSTHCNNTAFCTLQQHSLQQHSTLYPPLNCNNTALYTLQQHYILHTATTLTATAQHSIPASQLAVAAGSHSQPNTKSALQGLCIWGGYD